MYYASYMSDALRTWDQGPELTNCIGADAILGCVGTNSSVHHAD